VKICPVGAEMFYLAGGRTDRQTRRS